MSKTTGYPLFGSKGETRETPLLQMVATDRVLFCNGTKDDMVNIEELHGILDRTPAQTTVVPLAECDHSLKLTKKKKKKATGAAEEVDAAEGFQSQEDVETAIRQQVRNFIEP